MNTNISDSALTTMKELASELLNARSYDEERGAIRALLCAAASDGLGIGVGGELVTR